MGIGQEPSLGLFMGFCHVLHHCESISPHSNSLVFSRCLPFLVGRTTADTHQVMESFDMFLNGNFVALTPFQNKYGVRLANGDYAIPTRWQSALFQSGQCGAFVGVFLAGPITNVLGYRWTTILALILMNATIFISFFVSILTSLLNLQPDQIHTGRLPHPPCSRTSVGRCSLGILHCKLSCLRQ